MQSEMDVVLAEQLSYWCQQLAGAPALLDLPTDHPRPRVQSYHGAHHTLLLPHTILNQIHTLAQREGVTPFMILLAAFQVLLMRYSGQTDIVVGTPIANRSQIEMEGVMGYLLNTLALRCQLGGNPRFCDVLKQVREVALGAYAHQDVPFEKVVEALQPERTLSHSPLFQVMFVLQNAAESLHLTDLSITTLEAEGEIAKCDLTLYVLEKGHSLDVKVEYSTDLFDADTLERLLGHFQILLEGVVAHPEWHLSDMPFLTPAEQRQLLVEWNNTGTSSTPNACLHELFQEQAARTPQALAVLDQERRLTYGELNQRANQLAHYLRQLGVGSETLVGLCMDRSLEMMIALLGILKAGASYVPLDPTYPPERIAFMLADTQAPILLTRQNLAQHLPAHHAQVVCLDTDAHVLEQQDLSDPSTLTIPNNTAYVIYTSGSTGQPKGTLISHANVVRLFTTTQEWFHFSEHDVWTLFHSYAFDFSVWELWGALLYGGCLVVVPYEVSRSPESFLALLRTHQVTILNQTPSAFRQLMQAEEIAREKGQPPLDLRYVIFGGEALDVQSLRSWFTRYDEHHPQLVNMYGITETTVHVTSRLIQAQDTLGLPGSLIGAALPDLQTYVLDEQMQLVPIGVPGELYVGGAGLARGYLYRPDLTAERFVPHPFSLFPGARLYKTGDRVRFLSNGDLEYLGRLDHQVKIRGFRIELGEIEAKLAAHPAVQEVVVLVREDVPHAKRIVAYVVPHVQNASLSLDNPNTLIYVLHDSLKKFLPDYMIPAAFMILDAMPLNANGKIDRRALPLPSRDGTGRKANFVAPRTDVEKILANIWREILGIEHIGINDTFFELGGHSLLATQMITRIHSVFQVELSFRTFFEAPTIVRLLEVIEQAKGQESPKRVKPAISANARNTYRAKFSSETHV